jgi:hypothetical protein
MLFPVFRADAPYVLAILKRNQFRAGGVHLAQDRPLDVPLFGERAIFVGIPDAAGRQGYLSVELEVGQFLRRQHQIEHSSVQILDIYLIGFVVLRCESVYVRLETQVDILGDEDRGP